MSQLSNHGHMSVDPISMQTVRQTLDLGAAQEDIGSEGASNLFYYLFDDWRAVYSTIATFRERLKELVSFTILMNRRYLSNTKQDTEILSDMVSPTSPEIPNQC